jgi:KaiC/GvpD/RAD55 family RecA-like ATPase
MQLKRVKTGISGLDSMLGGGLIEGRPYLVMGKPGSGKTLLAMQFLLEGLKNDEECLFVTLEETPTELIENFASFGWDIGKVRLLDATPDIDARRKDYAVRLTTPVRYAMTAEEFQTESYDPLDHYRHVELTLESLIEIIRRELKEHFCRRMVIDPISAIRTMVGKAESGRLVTSAFMKFLSNLKITTILTMESINPEIVDIETYLARGVIRLHKLESTKGRIVRAISVEKMRGTPHDIDIRPIDIKKDTGIVVYADAFMF